MLEALKTTSDEMYQEFYTLLATYQFEFNRTEKEWMLQQIVKEIQEMNNSDGD